MQVLVLNVFVHGSCILPESDIQCFKFILIDAVILPVIKFIIPLQNFVREQGIVKAVHGSFDVFQGFLTLAIEFLAKENIEVLKANADIPGRKLIAAAMHEESEDALVEVMLRDGPLISF